MMRPAFSSTKQAAAFALLLFLLLILPAVIGKNLLPPREQAYAVQGWSSGPYPWIRNQIFEETNDIDIAILGSSHILQAIDTPYLQAKLGEKLNRPAIVRTLAWGGGGYDGLFFITQDLLAHRRVKLILFYDENPAVGLRNSAAQTWFRFGENASALAGLPVADQGLYYFAAVIGMPRNLLEQLRPNLPAPLVSNPPKYWESHYHTASVVKLLGATVAELGFNYDLLGDNFTAFTPFTPATGITPAAVEIYSPKHKGDFEFTRESVPAWQIHFAEKFSTLARENHARLVMLHIPVLAETQLPVIRERGCWPEILDGVTLLGIPPGKMFGGLTDEEVHKLFSNSTHLNKNGMDYFTGLISPAIINLYETPAIY